ncbi:tetraspanin [Elysia marginata]|uniref:Tetraspanin n=1 Tax=Elysia marginata TaxID=1093978 RepID=A0AAV4JAW1_9GAST|nr:tetraspanin [Elysia marginata]
MVAVDISKFLMVLINVIFMVSFLFCHIKLAVIKLIVVVVVVAAVVVVVVVVVVAAGVVVVHVVVVVVVVAAAAAVVVVVVVAAAEALKRPSRRFKIFGLAALIVGVLFKIGWDEVRHAFADNSEKVDINLQYAGDTLAYSAIVFGSFIVIVSLAGCVGACWRVKCLLTVYAIIVILLLIAEIIVVALAVKMGSDGRDQIADGLRDSLKNYKENSTDSRSKAFSALFSSLKCCGVENYTTDFTTDTKEIFYPALARDLTKYPLVIPITCCRDVDYESNLDASYFDKHSACLKSPTNENAYTKGCLDEIYDEIESNKAAFIGVGVTIFVIEVLVVVMSFILCCREDD